MTLVSPPAAAAAQTDLEDERSRLALLQAGLDLLDQGFIVVDRSLKLVAANRAVVRLLGLPREMARVGTPLADFIRYNAERGEYGAGDVEEIVAEQLRLARHFKPHYMERVRPDGTIIAIRSSPLPNDAWVTIYSDVAQQRAPEHPSRDRNEEPDRRVRERTARLEGANTEQKRLEAVLVHAQKMEAVGEMAGGLAHDFNNLLMIVISNLAMLRDRAAAAGKMDFAEPALVAAAAAAAGTMEYVEPALAAAVKGADITERLLAFARRQRLEPQVIEVNGVIANLLSLSRHSLPKTISISREPALFELYTRVDPQQLEHAFLNLLLNARDAMPRGGSLVVYTASRLIHHAEAAEFEVSPGRYVEVRVKDTGKGMDQATISRVFEPFFTTKQFGSGSGLGLSMIHGFVKQSGGAIDISSTPGKGTTVTLLLPASGAPTRPAAQRLPGSPPVVRSSRLVLLVEDDTEVRTVIRRQLTDIGHMVIEATTCDEALAIVDSVPKLSVLVSDIVMPGAIDGRRLAALAKQMRPELRVVLVTGYADGFDLHGGQYRSFTVLRKPCTKEELAAAIETAPQ
jgi:signal transduction histidine kinase/CheY-like chemotaxis protein